MTSLYADERLIWQKAVYFNKKYALYSAELKAARKNGLPYRKSPGGIYYYREKDINDYYAGRIGKDVEKARKKEC